MSFSLPQLEYSYDALEPHIDARTMEIHHSKHHQGYTNKLNAAIEGSEHESEDILDILEGLDMSNKALRNNAGGYYNHKLFWEVMNPNHESVMSDGLKFAINDALSVSYNDEEFEAKKNVAIAAAATSNTKTTVTSEHESIQVAYNLGGATLGLALVEVANADYTASKDEKKSIFTLAMEF